MAPRELPQNQLIQVVQAVTAALDPLIQAILDRLDAFSPPPAAKLGMTIETAAGLYDVNRSTLRIWCLRGSIPGAKKVGKRWYVTRDGMEQVFVVEGRRKRGRWPKR